MLKTIIDFRESEMVSLIPNSGVQFMDFAFAEAQVESMTRPVTFVEHDATGAEVTIYPVHIDQGSEDKTRFYYPRDTNVMQEVDDDNVYSVKGTDALERFDNEWLPFPFFRRSDKGFDEGPTTWSRIKIVKLPEPDEKGREYRVIMAFDTLLTPRLPGQPYTAPEENSDATDKVYFGFCADHDRNIGFMSRAWVSNWLREAYVRGLARQGDKPIEKVSINRPGEHWAAYMTFIEAIKTACEVPSIELVDIFSRHGRVEPVDVSLVLDVGNSRICGVLVEDSDSQSYADVAQTYRLELRDLSRVEEVYSEPFESRIEFSSSNFGSVRHASDSERTKREAFWWPSPVRIGPEAARLASLTDGTEGSSGLSSPKRYLWDTTERPQPWSNNNAHLEADAEPQEIRGPIISRLTESGQLVSRTKGAMPGLMRRYSRASVYMLMLCELLIHAATQVNSVDVRRNRANSGAPRAIKQVILTLPTATPLAEQKLMRERISEAVDIVWDVMDWDDDADGGSVLSKPRIHLDWDEATCTHLVYLYNEIQDKFRGTPREFISLVAQSPRNTPGEERLKVASIDIGGGTTDLMILSHNIQPGTDTVLAPEQVFREGFRLAGDDMLKEIVEHYLLPEISTWLGEVGIGNQTMLLTRLFGGNVEGMGQRERTMRAQLVSQVFSSAAIGLLNCYEKGEHAPGEKLRLGDLLLEDTVVAEPALKWFSEAAGLPAHSETTLLDATVSFDAPLIERLIDGLVGPMIRDLCDLVRCHDCDTLLISGRPSQFPIIRRMIEASMPVPANRIILMGQYPVGNWYPFRSDDRRIRDPKTTAVVGAMLAHICQKSVSNLTLRTEGLKMRSTAKFIGTMEAEGKIPNEKILLENVNLDTGKGVDEFALSMESSTFIGFRQLPIARWQGSPLYHVHFADPDKLAQIKLPLKVTFERNDNTREGEEEHAMEDFRVVSVDQADGEGMSPKAVVCRLQTMVIENQAEAGYWLDTGVLQMGEK
ncbi:MULTISPECIES: virulence factor SrfB [unclassified Roseovarius]|uniref:virulence factor SrfB n=1 Tax=unclassified Roseovarius TaxID=2614913 RepID=UPI00273EAC6F|nr:MULTISPECIES: virulence factor SrfB [unclassified Roseovarius]